MITFVRNRGVVFCAAVGWVSLVVFAALGATWMPVDPNRFDPLNGLAPPSLRHPFGTTRLGEDLFAQIIHGSRVSLLVGVGAALVALAIGVPLGLAAGYLGGRVDTVITIALDALVAFPALVLVSAVVLYRGQTLFNVVACIGVLTMPVLARITRAAARSAAERDYVTAARLAGATNGRIIWRELAPNIAVPVISYAFLVAGIAILVEGGLSFVGLGVPLENASWGRLVAAGRDSLESAWWWSLGPSAVIFLTILSLNLINDGLQRRWFLGRWTMPRVSRLPTSPRLPAPPRSPTSPTEARSIVEPVSAGAVSFSAGAVPDGLPAVPDGAPAAGAVLSIRDLRVHIPTPFGAVRALDGVSLTVAPRTLVALVGESGAGKTMLGRRVLAIEPEGAMLSGRVVFGNSAGPPRRGHDIAIVFQDPLTSLDPVMKVGWQVAEPARVHLGMGKAQSRRHALSLLAAVGIGEPARRFHQYPHELSGGMRQRVAIALALSCDPALLIADEPTSALDVTVQAQIMSLFKQLRRERDMAVLFITHDLALAAAHADEIVVMYAGRVVEQGSAEDVLSAPRMPYTRALLATAPSTSPQRGRQRLQPIPGSPPVVIREPVGCAFAPRCSFTSGRCVEEAPSLVGERHRVACWNPPA